MQRTTGVSQKRGYRSHEVQTRKFIFESSANLRHTVSLCCLFCSGGLERVVFQEAIRDGRAGGGVGFSIEGLSATRAGVIDSGREVRSTGGFFPCGGGEAK